MDLKASNGFADFDKILTQRRREADEFYETVIWRDLSADAQNVMSKSFSLECCGRNSLPLHHQGMARGRSGQPSSAPWAVRGRNHEWTHLYNSDVISMPDKWEYPWYAAWDLAFHCIPLALVDSDFAKETADIGATGMVHASQRSNTRL